MKGGNTGELSLPIMLDYIAVGFALVAIALTFWQLVTRHRPFVGVSKAEAWVVSDVEYEEDLTIAPNEILEIERIYGIIATITNWGPVPANFLVATASMTRRSGTEFEDSPTTGEAETLLPGQELRVCFSYSRPLEKTLNLRKPDLDMVVSIKYTGPGQIKRITPPYETKQSLKVGWNEWFIKPSQALGLK